MQMERKGCLPGLTALRNRHEPTELSIASLRDRSTKNTLVCFCAATSAVEGHHGQCVANFKSQSLSVPKTGIYSGETRRVSRKR